MYKEYSATLFKSINKNIIIDLPYLQNLDGTYLYSPNKISKLKNSNSLSKTNSYKIKETFNLFYDNSQHILIIDTKVPLAKLFLKDLKESSNSQLHQIALKAKAIKFNFNKVRENIGDNEIESISFKTGGHSIETKRFSGDNVLSDPESKRALKENRVTYMIFPMDVYKKSRILGFSQSGSIVIYSGVKDLKDKENPYINILSGILYKGLGLYIKF